MGHDLPHKVHAYSMQRQYSEAQCGQTAYLKRGQMGFESTSTSFTVYIYFQEVSKGLYAHHTTSMDKTRERERENETKLIK